MLQLGGSAVGQLGVNEVFPRLFTAEGVRRTGEGKKAAFTLAESATHVTSLQTATKFGFTLAEVLITLGIIGIVAALTIPSLIANYQKKVTAERLKQAYALITQTIKHAEFENEGPLIALTKTDKGDVVKKNFFAELYLVPYLSGITKTQYKKPPTTWKGISIAFSPSYIYCMQNGICFWSFGSGGYNSETDYGWLNYLYILVDINGPSLPNIVGKDIFYFAVHFKDTGTVIDGKTYAVKASTSIQELYGDSADALVGGCNKTGVNWSNGSTCTEIIMRNNWKIPKEYPW